MIKQAKQLESFLFNIECDRHEEKEDIKKIQIEAEDHRKNKS